MVEYLKEWNEACVYAGECLPPFVYELAREPYKALIGFGLAIFFTYLWNEYALAQAKLKILKAQSKSTSD